ncbi:hypothetical protein HZH66_012069 [Vespula vulgaris]|uniref:Uncharacterized protein n=1 Tax=Vespula vulgaris TaxID=7454 RepID=A0A834JB74_VESVU|nr:hypothetical protein HZH66_012069 [Vespula vulgaris]
MARISWDLTFLHGQEEENRGEKSRHRADRCLGTSRRRGAAVATPPTTTTTTTTTITTTTTVMLLLHVALLTSNRFSFTLTNRPLLSAIKDPQLLIDFKKYKFPLLTSNFIVSKNFVSLTRNYIVLKTDNS